MTTQCHWRLYYNIINLSSIPHSLLRPTQVCKLWWNLTKDWTIWRNKYERLLDGFPSSIKDIPNEEWEATYRKLYRREINWYEGQVKYIKVLRGHVARVNDAKLKDNILVTGDRKSTRLN